jgi:general secretion pathway protein D
MTEVSKRSPGDSRRRSHLPERSYAAASAVLALLLACGTALARQDSAPATDTKAADAAKADAAQPRKLDARGRRVVDGPPTVLAFKNVTVDQIVPFIVEATGKVVVPQQDVLTRKVTVLNDQPIPREQALDLVLMALKEVGVAVVENNGIVSLRDIAELVKADLPVLGPDESALDRGDLGTMAQKVFGLSNLTAEAVGEMLKDSLPDYSKLTVDKESNQVGVIGNIALLQRVERLLNALDRPSSASFKSHTFQLKYADAAVIAEQIRELFSGEGPAGQRSASRRNAGQNQNQNRQWWGGQQGGQEATTSEGMRVSSNIQQNSITVVAEPAVLEQIGNQIKEFWDLPLDVQEVVPKTYELKNSDPIKVRDLLTSMFNGSTGTTGAGSTNQNRQGGGQQGQQNQGGGASSNAASNSQSRLIGQFTFQAMPDSGKLVVLSKSRDNFKVLDDLIADLDKPQTVGLPAIVELKHANSEDLAEQLNTLLAQDGTLAQIKRAESGLNTSDQNSPFSQTTTTTDNGQTTTDQVSSANIAFWWQRSRPPTTNRGPSNVVGMVRIVPVWRQNAVMVLAPPEYKNSIVSLISDLDRPGRQVLISAIVAEMSTDDALALGIRWSSQPITPTNGDNSLSIGGSSANTKNNFLDSLFDTSTLTVNADLNVLIQALATTTDFQVLSRPTIFTSDNQEASFFDGQDVPFITESQPNNNGNLLQSFDYRAVGLDLRVRPRITVKKDIDLRVNIELSSIVPGQTLFGGAVVDRRETTTQLIVKDGQTVVISGIIRNELTDIVRKVPFLGDIPLLGELFKSREKTNKATELFVFITPIVINNTDDADAMNEPYRKWLELQKKSLNVPDGPYPGLQPDVPAAKRDPTDPRPDEKAPEKPESDAQLQQSSADSSGSASQSGSQSIQ